MKTVRITALVANILFMAIFSLGIFATDNPITTESIISYLFVLALLVLNSIVIVYALRNSPSLQKQSLQPTQPLRPLSEPGDVDGPPQSTNKGGV